MTFEQFLGWLLTSTGSGAFIFGAIEFVDTRVGHIDGRVKFWASLALGVLVPLDAYLGEVKLGLATFGIDGLWNVALVAWGVSQLIHFGADKVKAQ